MSVIYRTTALSVAAALAASWLVAAPAVAETPGDQPSVETVTATDVENSLGLVASSTDGLVQAPVDSVQVGAQAAVAETEAGLLIEIPLDADAGVRLSAGTEELNVGIPSSESAGQATRLDDGTIVYPGTDSSATSIVPLETGVQMLTTITGPEAPTRFEYPVELQPGQRLELDGEGAVVIGSDGEIDTVVAPAWAVDARGEAVDTRYEVSGSVLVQVVEHSTDADVAYPVVADPIWLAPWVVRCLTGIGLNAYQISRIASSGSPWAVGGALGFAALRCILGR